LQKNSALWAPCAHGRSQDAPGDAAARLRSVRVRTESGETSAAVDIRNPFGIEVSYEVLENGRALLPVIELYNEETDANTIS